MWNKESHRSMMKPSAGKLISYFATKGVQFSPMDGEFENVVFSKADKVLKISHHSFYKYSGISCIYKEIKEHMIEPILVTPDMYMEKFMKPIIEAKFL